MESDSGRCGTWPRITGIRGGHFMARANAATLSARAENGTEIALRKFPAGRLVAIFSRKLLIPTIAVLMGAGVVSLALVQALQNRDSAYALASDELDLVAAAAKSEIGKAVRPAPLQMFSITDATLPA